MAIADFEGYFEVEDDSIESQNAIDPVWEQQQKKTFTAWCNSHLRKVSDSIESIENDFRDGLKLMRLLEVISGEHLPRPDKGKMRVHKIANVNKALDFIVSKGVKLVSIGAEEIVDGNVKMTLGMIWTIILRFAIQNIQIEDFSAKDGLLLWCQRQTAPYKNVNVVNFSTSFKDGLAFCAIIHRNRPDLLSYDQLKPENAYHNLNLAFDVAEKQLDIPRMLDPDDMVKSAKPDERSVMAYVSSYYHLFAGANKANIAANRISNLLKANRENARLIEEYETIASDLLAWIKNKYDYFSTRSAPLNVAEAEELQESYRNYNCDEKPTKLREKARLEVTYNTIQTRLRLNKRPPYVPAVEKHLEAISDKWNELDNVSNGFEEWLLLELQRLRRIDYLLRKFEIRCTTHEAWAAGQPQILASEDYLSCTLPELRALLKRHEAFESQVEANGDRVERIQALANELANLRYHDMISVNNRYNAIVHSTDEIRKLTSARKDKLMDVLAVLEKIDQLQLEFAKRADPFKNWTEQTEEDLRDMPNVHTMVDVEGSLEAHEQFEMTLSSTEMECKAIEDLAKEVEQLAKAHRLVGVTENLYTNIKPGDPSQRMRVVRELTKKRSELLRAEKEKQMNNEKMRVEFAKKAAEFDKWMRQQKANIMDYAVESRGSLEEQCESLKMLEAELKQHKPMLDELEQCNQALERAHATENIHTALTMPTLRIAWEQLFSNLHHTVNLLENQILTRDSKGLSAEQMEELRASFHHFDRNRSGRLDPPEFKACLLSVGHSFGDSKREKTSTSVISESEFAQIMKLVDPEHKGYVTFDAFVDYMTRENSVESTEELLTQSFKHFAGDKGYVTAQDVERYLPSEDAQYCLRFLVRLNGPMGDDGGLDYKKFATEIHNSPCL